MGGEVREYTNNQHTGSFMIPAATNPYLRMDRCYQKESTEGSAGIRQ